MRFWPALRHNSNKHLMADNMQTYFLLNRSPKALKNTQAGGTMAGVVLGLLAGLAVALGVALYVTNAPMPFATKTSPVPEKPLAQPVEGQTPPDPNLSLLPKEARDFISAPNIQVTTPTQGGAASTPAMATLFFLETGKFKSAEDAEQMRVRLMLASVEANVTEVVSDAGSPFRVRVGPFPTAEEAYRARTRITENGFEAKLVKVGQ